MNIIFIPKATINTGDITVDITPPTQGTADVVNLETTGEETIPAGQRYVWVYVAGAVQPGDEEVNATIAGESRSVGSTYEFKQTLDEVNNVLLLSPEIVVNGNGTRLFIIYWS